MCVLIQETDYRLLRFSQTCESKVQKPPSQLRFSLPSIIVTITSNETWNTETHKMHRNPPITNHEPWPFEPVKVKFCFLRGPLRWLTAAKNAIVKAAFELQNSHVCEKRSNQYGYYGVLRFRLFSVIYFSISSSRSSAHANFSFVNGLFATIGNQAFSHNSCGNIFSKLSYCNENNTFLNSLKKNEVLCQVEFTFKVSKRVPQNLTKIAVTSDSKSIAWKLRYLTVHPII